MHKLTQELGKCKHVLRLLSTAGTASAHQGVYTINSYDYLQKSDSNAQAHTRVQNHIDALCTHAQTKATT